MRQVCAYRWTEDGILGICDNHQYLCFALAFWNGKDPILKERLFGLTGNQGNHGEDVKELYYYLDATPTASYLKGLYKYPHAEYPYQWLLDENRKRRQGENPEFEIQDTGSVCRWTLLRHFCRIRKARFRRHPDPGNGCQPRSGCRANTSADTLVSQYLVADRGNPHPDHRCLSFARRIQVQALINHPVLRWLLVVV